ncbi:MAG: RNA polymerase sigma factor RpoH [Gammaproteobacteria bacterium CG11_big_fil_rev_8_21_14_0_20_46_22]|nr:MAG: RNA polymerase sigma factor RpoH [Gammaproteobacteria bacterium CG12_big_fil_rev_8_21_14_0_65_46_12]PIR10675.1 MAG: RNA polymerase sigma factor RpoH [Gammaproteobacteria bacterium CG11_big_fil_rev_8_21_14_0_20_46_22]
MTRIPALNVSLSVDNVSSYMHFVNSFPLLSQAEEVRLAQAYHEQGSLEAARQLVVSHLRFVVKIARKYSGYGLSEADLIQEGNIGLMKAVKRFDPKQGVRLVSFAVHWIKAEINEFVLKNWRIVKVATTKAQRKLFFNLRKMKTQLAWFKESDVQDIAKDLDVKPETVREMESRMYAQDAAYDVLAEHDDDNVYTPADYLVSAELDPETALVNESSADDQQTRLIHAMGGLDERSRVILEKRFLAEPKATLHDLADELGVSAERVRQLEKQALAKIKAAM